MTLVLLLKTIDTIFLMQKKHPPKTWKVLEIADIPTINVLRILKSKTKNVHTQQILLYPYSQLLVILKKVNKWIKIDTIDTN